ncbi:unnamed protein product, partial [Polarella glacialis]
MRQHHRAVRSNQDLLRGEGQLGSYRGVIALIRLASERFPMHYGLTDVLRHYGLTKGLGLRDDDEADEQLYGTIQALCRFDPEPWIDGDSLGTLPASSQLGCIVSAMDDEIYVVSESFKLLVFGSDTQFENYAHEKGAIVVPSSEEVVY